MAATYIPPAAAEVDPVASAALASNVASLTAAIALKQDQSTAATDAELAAAVALDRARLDAVESGGGTTIGESTATGASVELDFETHWGVNATGDPYFEDDPANITPGEEAVLIPGPFGLVAVVKPTTIATDENTPASRADLALVGGGGGGGAGNVFVQPDPPAGVVGNYLWVETGLGAGSDVTFWIEDGA